MHLPIGTLLQGGRYEILRFISSGGFGCTYEARDRKFKSRVKSVAIKEFFVKDFCNRDASSNRVVVGTLSKKKLVDKLRNKFLEEADALFELEHSNIVRVTDTFEENGTAYYVMEYINGSSLANIIEKSGALGEQEALGYIRQVADALAYVHSCTRLHLDVKPGNIMIDHNGKAVLIDFGVSKQYDEESGENTSTLMGYSPGYAPIEQSESGALDNFTPATDIYALGATFFFLLTGQRPPKASEVMNYGLPELPQEISPQVRNAVATAMNPVVRMRPQSIEEFINKVKAESFDDDETRVGINPPRPSATPSFEKVGELSKTDSDDEATRINNSSTLRGEVSRSDGGEKELPKVKAESGNVKGENDDNEETRINSSSTLRGEVSRSDGGGTELSKVKAASFDNTSSDKSCAVQTPFAPHGSRSASVVKTENGKSKLPLIIIILLLSVILGVGGYLLFSGGGETPEPPQPPFVVEPGKRTTPLYVNTTPSGADVYVDGKYIGATPISGYEIEQGQHTVNIAKEGYKEYEKIIAFDNATKDLGTINLEKLTYKLTIKTIPSGATVKIDGKVIGKTPLSSYEIEQGQHTVNITKNGYEQKTEVVEFGRDTELSYDLVLVEYVDLGLSVKWAACNVGATKPEDCGGLYDWNESQQLATGNSRLPTKEEMQELKERCTWTWTTQNGVKGRKVTGPNGNSIFLPAAGDRCIPGGVYYFGSGGHYWSSTPYGAEDAWFLNFNSGDVNMYRDPRQYGHSVRLVQD